MAETGQPGGSSLALLTDLYELTMAAAYFENRVEAPATFELFVRNLPDDRGFLLAAGLQQALDYLETLSFSSNDITFLQGHPAFVHVSPRFFEFLRSFRFTGEVWAIGEGTPVFALEPLLRVTAPVIEAQLAETFLLSVITFQTLIATKAARVVQSAAGRQVVEFGSRHAHGPQAGVLAARAAYIGGCVGTSNVEAHRRFGVPTFGTLAHSFIMAYEHEEESWRDFERVFPNPVLLVDTYDTLAAVDKIIAAGLHPAGVRLDSGDLVALSSEVRRRLDQGGLHDTRIVASGDLDERSIAALLAAGAPIDTFGVGTALATSLDAPALSGVYKLVEFGSRPRIKLSHDKASYPCRKQVFRTEQDRLYQADTLALAGESCPGRPLLQCVMRQGKRLEPSPPLKEIRDNAAQALPRLPPLVRALENPARYPVHMSARLSELWKTLLSDSAEPALSKTRG